MPESKIIDTDIEERLELATEQVGPEEIFKALEAWEQVADLVPDDEVSTSSFTFSTGR